MNSFDPGYQGSEKSQNPIITQKIKKLPTGLFESSNEVPGCTDYNAKNLNSLRCTVAEKIKKKTQK